MPDIPLKLYLQEALVPATETEIIVRQPKFFATLGELLQSEPRAVWRAYLCYHALKDASLFLAAPFEDESFRSSARN